MDKKNNTPAPLVSVIIPAFNEQPSIISEAISSIVHQSYTNIEIHVFDDSTDQDTRKAIDSFSSYPNIFIHRCETRFGFVHSLNIGLDISKGKYIARMDSDDISLPDRIQKQVFFLESNPQIDLVGGALELINQDGKTVSFRKYPTTRFGLLFYAAFRCPFAHPTILMRKSIVERGFFYNESLTKAEDLDFWLRLIQSGHKCANLPDCLLKYRVTQNFLDKRGDMLQRQTMAKVRAKNVSFRHPFLSFFSFLTGFVAMHLPRKIVDIAYRLENKI